MNKTILKFCNEIHSNPKLKSEMTNKILEYCKNNDTSQSKINIINEIILPTATKMGFDFSAEELLDHENNVKNKLTLEDLESVSGGVGVKAKVMSLFAALNLSSGILAKSTTFAMDPPSSSPNSYSTSSSTSQNKNNSNNTSSNSLTQVKAKSDAAGENQTMSKEETINAVMKDIVKELKNSGFDFEIEVTKDRLHSIDDADELSTLIKNFNAKSKEIAKTLNQNSSFRSLKRLIEDTNDQILCQTFNALKNCSSPEREKVAAMLILDDWAASNNFSHNISVMASPYFMDEEGNPLWPDNNGYRTDTEIKDIISEMNTGYKIDRYGSEYGFYVCSANDNAGVSYAKRALANRENKNLYHKYTVTRNFSELKTVIDELGLTECLELENKAVNVYKTIKGQIKTDFQIRPNANPYSKEDNFNYKQLQSLIQNKDSIDDILILNANKDQVEKKFDELEQTLSTYKQVFETAKKNISAAKEKFQTLQNNIEGGYINLTDNLKNSKANSGPIAPAFKQEGGGEQIELPCSVGVLKALGFLQDATD